jgi:hypothetical protein
MFKKRKSLLTFLLILFTLLILVVVFFVMQQVLWERSQCGRTYWTGKDYGDCPKGCYCQGRAIDSQGECLKVKVGEPIVLYNSQGSAFMPTSVFYKNRKIEVGVINSASKVTSLEYKPQKIIFKMI